MDVIIQTPFESLNQELQKNLTLILSEFPKIKIHLIANLDWGSDTPNNREHLREYRKAHQGNFLYSSISHCNNLGFLVFCNYPIGIDIEQSARVKWNVVERISSHEEIQEIELAMLPANFLWCAKEASYKALKGFNQPSIASAINITDWSAGMGLYQFKLGNLQDFTEVEKQVGWVHEFQQWTLSTFTFLK